MLCDQCGEREAAIHLTQIKDNTVQTAHLCEQCAAEQGVQSGPSAAKLPLASLIASLGQGAAAALPATADAGRCSFCGASLEDFRETGRLGCAHCYATFERHLRELLRRIHGSSQHVGEVYLPPRHDARAEPERTLAELKTQLRRAVDAEDFERAAELRDRIRMLE
jgi:protein arginine kinase activator